MTYSTISRIETGRFLAMPTSESLQGMSARLETKFFNTTGICMEFFYWIIADLFSPSLYVSSLSEDGLEIMLTDNHVSLNDLRQGWKRITSKFYKGIYKIVIQGQRSFVGVSGLFIDDIIVKPCKFFGKHA